MFSPNEKSNFNNEEWRASAPSEQEQSVPLKGYSQPAPNPYGPIPPIVNQPGVIPSGGFNTPDRPMSFYPPGLQHLAYIDKFILDQCFIREGFRNRNTYEISNGLGEQIYSATEAADCLQSIFGSDRKFTVSIFDNFKNEVIHLYLPLNWDCCSFTFPSMEVSSPPGTVVGLVDQEIKFFGSNIALKNLNGEIFLRIMGPSYRCCEDVMLNIFYGDQVRVAGRIVRQQVTLGICSMPRGHYEVTFPMNLDVTMKAVLLGASILVDTLLFSRKNKSR